MRSRWAARAVLAALLTGAPVCHAEGLTLGVDPAPAGDRALTVRSADVRGALLPRGTLLAEYAREPFVLMQPNQRRRVVVQDQLRLHALASLAVAHRWLFALDLPFTLLEDGEGLPGAASPPEAPALGDLRLSARARLLGPAGTGAHAGLELGLWLPTGKADSYSGDEAVRAGLNAIVSGHRDRFAWSVEGGVATRPTATLAGSVLPVRLGTSLNAGASAKWLVDSGRMLQLGPELTLASVVGGDAELLDPLSTEAQFTLGAELRPGAGPWFARLGAGPGFGEAPGAAAYRAFLAFGWSRESAPPPPDRDDDGVADASDACIDLPGARSSDPLMNGCPELPDDLDGDAIWDRFDACPREAGEATGDRRTHGCPPKPPAAPPPKPPEPPPPPPPPARLEAEQIVITEEVQFEIDTATLLPASDPVLRAVAEILTAHPEVELVEIEGHTDDTGTPEHNLRLSQARADAVRSWLVEHGIAAERLSARGYGKERPIADNTSAEGRAKNRRVAFRVLKRAGAAP